ncbi:MAG: sugar phosphate isomerase/epimerase family protein [Geminicoccaceae bacterium]
MSNLPVLGAALPVEDLEANLDWLVQDKRDLELQSFFKAETLNGDWRPVAARAKSLLASHEGRLGIHGPFPGFSLSSEDPDVREVVKKRLNQGLDVCEELGASQMVIHSPYKSWDLENLENVDDGPQKMMANVRACLDQAVGRAENIGVEMVLENCEDRDPHARVRLAEAFASPALRVSIDTGHAYYAHTIGHAPAVDRYVRAAGNMLSHVHLQDADGFADRHWALGEGTISWPSVFAELAKLSSNPRLIIELRDKGQVQRSARWMESLGLAR